MPIDDKIFKKKAGQGAAGRNPTIPPKARSQDTSIVDQARKKMAEMTAKKQAKTYVVQPGDSLSKIAKELLGDAARWSEIFELNKDQIKDPNLIQVGQELRLP
ncbi:MAG: LysM peptidoglycan-binding domain-containing protein [Anaerolineae bacterium]|jgi:nucleoid-associated protein YgaU